MNCRPLAPQSGTLRLTSFAEESTGCLAATSSALCHTWGRILWVVNASADATPEHLYTPAPPWRIGLTGAENDLQDLVTQHSTGQTRVLHFQGKYFLEADGLNKLSDPQQVYEKAQGILHIICGLAKVRRYSALPVTAVSVSWTDGKNNWLGLMSFPSVRYRAVPGNRYVEGANISEQILALAQTNEVARLNLIDFLGEWDFSRLRRITRNIMVDLGCGNVKRGAEEVVRLGWATEAECARFDESSNFGNRNFFGAHSKFELAPGQNQNPLSLVMASEFVRKLLAQWLTSKIASSGQV